MFHYWKAFVARIREEEKDRLRAEGAAKALRNAAKLVGNAAGITVRHGPRPAKTFARIVARAFGKRGPSEGEAK